MRDKKLLKINIVSNKLALEECKNDISGISNDKKDGADLLQSKRKASNLKFENNDKIELQTQKLKNGKILNVKENKVSLIRKYMKLIILKRKLITFYINKI